MPYVIRLVGLVRGISSPYDGQYLVAYDPDVLDERGHLLLRVTSDIGVAKHFSTPREALNLWQRQSLTAPLRDDLKPNRPLTAFTIEVLPVAR